MYTAIFIVLFGLGAIFFIIGLKNDQRPKVVLGAIIAVLTVLFYWFMGFWGEMLWFNEVGYGNRFWIVELAQIVLTVICFLLSGLIVYLIIHNLPRDFIVPKIGAVLLAAISGGIWGFGNWEVILKFWNRVESGLVDPIIGKDTGFYLFSLPMYESVYGILIALVIIALIASLLPILIDVGGKEPSFRSSESMQFLSSRFFRPFFISAALFFILLAWGKYLDRFDLMYSDWGAVSGPGWTDVNIRLPAFGLIAIITFIFGVGILIPQFRNLFRRLIWKWKISNTPTPIAAIVMMSAFLFAFWLIVLSVIPGAFQFLRVEPNEITFERPYIENNIEFTRHGFKLDSVQEREFPASDTFNSSMIQQNRNIFENIRLWDYRALDNVYKQFQEIRLYYEFQDVDIDRYMIDGNYRQVMVSAREMETSNLPAQSQTFVNKRFKYTHGFGITLSNVNDFTEQGLPNMLVKNIPPVSAYPELEVEEPRIYYGELTDQHVIVNSSEEEFDYPSGEENNYISYPGSGGVQISNIWRKFLFGYKFDGTRLFFSSYPTSESRIMFHRNIRDRVSTIAPFLRFDNDPYIVLAEGRLYWMIDAYTYSNYYPYSEPYQGINYLRNSVKITIDAFNGDVNFYLFEPEDPIIRVWDNIFPGMFKSKEEMPEVLLKHIRYPSDMLEMQGNVYAKYHMNDPTVFYNQEDLWIRATEKYYDRVQAVEPYYIIWESPEDDRAEYVLMMPFTPKNRQVMIGWIAGLCDPPNYGEFLAYKFPKDKRILGPQQVETKIDQDSYLSGQLSLWDQRGSRVIRGNVLAIPIENTILYVEPIYLQAETAAYPELRLVAVMHNDNLSYAESFNEALNGLLGETAMIAEAAPEAQEVTAQIPGRTNMQDLINSANQAFENYIESTGDRDFPAASEALSELQNALQQLSAQGALPQDTAGIPTDTAQVQ